MQRRRFNRRDARTVRCLLEKQREDPIEVANKFNFNKSFLKPNNELGLNAKIRKKFKGNCELCGRQGHKKYQCWENLKNAHLRPKGWKSILKFKVSDEEKDDDDMVNKVNPTNNSKL